MRKIRTEQKKNNNTGGGGVRGDCVEGCLELLMVLFTETDVRL
jgi:hypothetical protein